MKKMFLPIVAICMLTATFITIEASSQQDPGDGGKVTCYARWNNSGVEDFTNCNGCSMVYSKSNPTDQGECRP